MFASIQIESPPSFLFVRFFFSLFCLLALFSPHNIYSFLLHEQYFFRLFVCFVDVSFSFSSFSFLSFLFSLFCPFFCAFFSVFFLCFFFFLFSFFFFLLQLRSLLSVFFIYDELCFPMLFSKTLIWLYTFFFFPSSSLFICGFLNFIISLHIPLFLFVFVCFYLFICLFFFFL